ncbi:MAG TPA: 4-hydroxy-tetrahydrodipicolinate synthase [Cytophagaceae bacterium]|jgi:4-hydroxy-tetrahydrodipicolinate synthase|nr:4-hydroxy-tetrahydrodipicolinate synthase [Cytophagaceae bacterium]
MQSKFIGTGVALVTPFHEDGMIDYDAYKKLINHAIDGGVDYLLVNGTTGESATTSEMEKADMLAFVKKENNGRVGIVYGIGGNNTAEIVRTIQNADFKGVDAILSVSPYYNKPTQEGIFLHYTAIADASPVPVILYNVPGRTMSNISAKTTIRLSHHKNIAGIKEASGNLEQAMEIAKYASKDFILISGDDLVTVPMISIGAKGVMSVLANAYPAQFSKMLKLALHNDFAGATEILKMFIDINPSLYEEGNPVGIKLTLELLGICRSNVRLPLAKASQELKEKMKKAMAEIK